MEQRTARGLFAWLGVLLVLVFIEMQIPPATSLHGSQPALPAAAPKPTSEVSFWGKLTGDPVALFTLALFLATGVLGYATFGLLKATRKSAEISERALTLLERPFVVAEVRDVISADELIFDPEARLGSGRTAGRPLIRISQVRLAWPNYGRTPAILRRLFYEFLTAPTGSIPDPIDPGREAGRELPSGTITDRESEYSEVENLAFRLSLDEQFAMGEGAVSLWLIGFILYDDFFGTSHINGFCMAYDHIGRRFVRRGDVRYNYARAA